MVIYNDNLAYEVFDDGYDIYTKNPISGKFTVSLTQRDPYSKLFDSDGTYEENAIYHCKSIAEAPEPQPQPDLTQVEKNQANIDYLALMLDVELPS